MTAVVDEETEIIEKVYFPDSNSCWVNYFDSDQVHQGGQWLYNVSMPLNSIGFYEKNDC